jgi:hypothetical protein
MRSIASVAVSQTDASRHRLATGDGGLARRASASSRSVASSGLQSQRLAPLSGCWPPNKTHTPAAFHISSSSASILAADRPAKSCATSSAWWHSPSPVSTTSQAGATHKPRRSGKVRVPYMTFIPWLADVATVVCAVLLWLIYRVVREEYHLTIEGDVVSASPRPPDGYVLTFTLTNTGRHRIVITALVNTSYGESWKLDTQPPPPYVLDPSDQKLLACAWDALSSRPTSIWAIDSSKRRWYMNRKQLRELVFRYQSSHHS